MIIIASHVNLDFDGLASMNKNIKIPSKNTRVTMRNLAPQLLDVLLIFSRLADQLGIKAYLVGGAVRDLLLNIPSLDVDIVVEGDGIDFAHNIKRFLDAEVVDHERFGTVTLLFPSKVKVDVASARREYYEYPAALPQVEAAELKEDLCRRDFTINAMAIQLNGKKWGSLIDFLGGYSDIINKKIRVMHNFSFIEDPTRILRAVRFEGRYGYQMEPTTERLAMDHQALVAVAKLSGVRIWAELSALFAQTKPSQSLNRLFELGVLEVILPGLYFDQDLRSLLIQLEGLLEDYPGVKEQIDHPIIYLGCLVHRWSKVQVISLGKKFGLSKQNIRKLIKISQIKSINLPVSQCNMINLHEVFQGWPDEAVVFLIAAQREINTGLAIKYVQQRKSATSFISGQDLVGLGISPGPRIKEILKLLEGACLDGLITNREEAVSFSRSLIIQTGGN
ncbi:MAG: CCA tRNA nucleotidyltransferase [Syntrophomonadaceae bacterium]|nr:CCA tRNA nucleotidyltransferase [Syntrophomonadaceae bacterium]